MNDVLETLIIVAGVVILIAVILGISAAAVIFALNGLLTVMGFSDHLIPWTFEAFCYVLILMGSFGGISLGSNKRK